LVFHLTEPLAALMVLYDFYVDISPTGAAGLRGLIAST